MAGTERSATGKEGLPDRIAPMLAQAVEEPFDSPDYLFEIKWDGTRCLAFVEAGRIRLQNRRYLDMTARYPEFAGLDRLPPGTVLDGEIVVLQGGKPSFEKLAQRDHLSDPGRIAMMSERLPATLVVFDLLYAKGASCMGQPLHERLDRMQSLIKALGDPHILASQPVIEHGRQYFAGIKQAGLEGVMAKRLDSPYLPGKRSSHWVKIKVTQTAAFDIVGFTQRAQEPVISALVLARREGGAWIYLGNVGSGFTEHQRGELYASLQGMPQLEDPPRDGPGDAQWRRTGLRCSVRFFELTSSGKLRGPVFRGFVA